MTGLAVFLMSCALLCALIPALVFRRNLGLYAPAPLFRKLGLWAVTGALCGLGSRESKEPIQ